MKNLMIKKIVFLSIIMILFFSTAALSADVFSDVPEDHWAADAIKYFSENKIVDGIGNNLFEPNSKITREQFAKVILLTFSESTDNDSEQIFSDVPPHRWSFAYVSKCKDFLPGYKSGDAMLFNPDEEAMREDIAAALIRMMGIVNTTEDYIPVDNFTDDEDITPELKHYVSLAYEYKLISGYPDGSFRPTDGISRAETVVLLDRAIKLHTESQNKANPNIIVEPETREVNSVLTLDLTYPNFSASDTAVISGTAFDSAPNSNIIIVINDEITLSLKSGEDFSQSVPLEPDNNIFLIKAYSETSNTVSRTIDILYEMEEDYVMSEDEEEYYEDEDDMIDW